VPATGIRSFCARLRCEDWPDRSRGWPRHPVDAAGSGLYKQRRNGLILRRELCVAANSKRPSRRRIAGAIEQACRDLGLRMTGQRRLIARILDEAEDHPDVVELHRRAALVDNRMSLSTVYRTVKLLETEGIIERLDFRDSRSRYEQATREHHDHLINLDTGDVIEFRSEEIEALQTEIARRLGYRLVHHRLELYAVPLDKSDE
jgi:Fur family transcriptional regulator, ferric uptake regulator